MNHNFRGSNNDDEAYNCQNYITKKSVDNFVLYEFTGPTITYLWKIKVYSIFGELNTYRHRIKCKLVNDFATEVLGCRIYS